MVFCSPIFNDILGSQFKYFFARAMSGFRRCGSSSTAGIVSILLVLPPIKSRMITANSGMKLRQTSIETKFYFNDDSMQANLQLCAPPDFQCSLVECSSSPSRRRVHQLNRKCTGTIWFAFHCHKSVNSIAM